jgi:lipopolysaccharide transport system ATP-binding protein
MIAVHVQNLRKTYRIYRSPAFRLKEIFLRRSFHTEFTALDGINFDVLQGETIGIIGENGAGKSTLLKILAKTLKPSAGTVETNGRSAALLELGAGFNPEFTGEENIYLNAYLMGLSKAEIDSKKNEIIEFSELGDFINRPVKTYSSGMHIRLGFSIATSVDPQILIVDEALSVGDEYFQKKSIDRMMGFRNSGRTIVFCSHSMYHIQELCHKAVWLHKGLVKNIGDTGKIITDYQNHERGKSAILKEKVADMVEETDHDAKKLIQIVDVRILDGGGSEVEAIRTFDPLTLSFGIRCHKSDIKGHIGFAITRNDEVMSFGTTTKFDNLSPVSFRDGQQFKVRIDSLPLLGGLYSIVIVAADEFALHPYDIFRTKNFLLTHSGKEFGMTYLEHEWLV